MLVHPIQPNFAAAVRAVEIMLPTARTGEALWQALSGLIPSEGERAQFLSHRSDRA